MFTLFTGSNLDSEISTVAQTKSYIFAVECQSADNQYFIVGEKQCVSESQSCIILLILA